MATIGEVGINVVARTGKLRKGLSQSQRMMAGFKKAAMGIGGVLAGAFAVSRVKGFLTQAADAVDESNKMARALGVSLEFMQGIEHAANLTGANMASVTKVMTQLSAETGKAGDVALLQFAERMDGIADAAERVQLAVSMFGERRAMDVLKLMDEGGAGLRAAIEERAGYGVLSAGDAMAIERANDAMTRLQTATQAVWQRFAADLAPAIKTAADSITRAFGDGALAKDVSQFVSLFGFGLADLLAGAFEMTTAFFLAINGIATDLQNMILNRPQRGDIERAFESAAIGWLTGRAQGRMDQTFGYVADYLQNRAEKDAKPKPTDLPPVRESATGRTLSRFLLPSPKTVQRVEDKAVVKAVDKVNTTLQQVAFNQGTPLFQRVIGPAMVYAP